MECNEGDSDETNNRSVVSIPCAYFSAPIVIDADDFFDGTIISNEFPGTTLSGLLHEREAPKSV